MIYFGIPLRSRHASKNWEQVTRVFNRTLHSVYRQTDPDFKIIVACHDIPEITFDIDNRVIFLVADTPYPKDSYEMMLDKGWKISMIAQKIREFGGGYAMMVDSDDLISNRIAGYVKAHPNENGFLSQYGYIYNEGFTYAKRVLALHRICGSCAIVNYSVDDLPPAMPENLWDDTPKDKWIVRKSHRIIPDTLKQAGRPLSVMPFPTTMYLRNTGDNHSMLNGSDLVWKRKLELALRRKIDLHGDIGKEFGFSDEL